MVAAQQGQQQEQRIVLHNISWETYERLLADHASSSAPRFTYDRGELEIMSPQPEHENTNWAIEHAIEIAAELLGIDFWNLGSTTFRRDAMERGFEPDCCFYIRNEASVRGKDRIDLVVDPPPDIVVEVDLTHSSMGTLGVYAAFGVPEVWRYSGGRLAMLRLADDTYEEIPASRELPGVPSATISELVAASALMGRIAWLRRVRGWAAGLVTH